MAGTSIFAGVGTGTGQRCSSPYPSPYGVEKVRDSPYLYSYLVNAEIPRQHGDEFGQYPRGGVYL